MISRNGVQVRLSSPIFMYQFDLEFLGRVTLNILLSFAQFEREVTAERIKDKITASKAKGM